MLAVERDVKPRNINFAKVERRGGGGGGGICIDKYGICPQLLAYMGSQASYNIFMNRTWYDMTYSAT